MHSVLLFFLLIVIGSVIGIGGNSLLQRYIEPRRSFKRFVWYFIAVLVYGFFITVIFSYIILRVVVPHK